ncbi:MAG TPA: prephenate dehydratase [Verrucomicrobiae bacterium]|jgi:prephenate dehydratase|nr:prephenate dehydratase [Verrucomicrobiae bacterium]
MKVPPSSRVAFQGERGAFSEEAAVKLLGEDIQLIPRTTFEALYSSILDGVADYILAPIENSLAGSVHRSYDLLISSGLHIQAEVVIPIAHYLIGVPGATFERITQVSSHPVALAQCERFFASHPAIKRVATDDTAGSVREVMAAGDPTRAGIASKRAAKVYGAQILRERLEDHPENYTRFLLLATSAEIAENADKLSLVLHLAHKPGSLCSALGAFAKRNLNLLKIESRPIPGTPWSYCFYLDLQASLNDADTRAALAEVERFTDSVKVLGCYPQTKG